MKLKYMKDFFKKHKDAINVGYISFIAFLSINVMVAYLINIFIPDYGFNWLQIILEAVVYSVLMVYLLII